MPFQKGNQVNRGRIPWNKGKPWSKKMKDKFTKIQRKFKFGKRNKGKKRTTEMKEHMRQIKTGANNPLWKGGRRVDDKGYILINDVTHPNRPKRRYMLEHRLVMEKHLGRYLKKEEVVHHINSIPSDNRIENLMLFPNEIAHKKFHHQYTSSYKK
jgi:hypothetical protein